jgi:hypothetical protein
VMVIICSTDNVRVVFTNVHYTCILEFVFILLLLSQLVHDWLIFLGYFLGG